MLINIEIILQNGWELIRILKILQYMKKLTKMSKMTGKMGKFDIKKQKCVLLVCDIQNGNLLKKILNEKKVRYVKRSPRRRFGSKRISQQIRSISHG